jgi:hypothetical protein
VAGDTQVGLGEFASRGLAVAKLAEDGKLPTEAPKVEPEAKQEPEAKVTETTQGIGGRNASKPKEQPKRRPRTRKQPAKEAATV